MRSSLSTPGSAARKPERSWSGTEQQDDLQRSRAFSNESRTSRITRPRGSSPTSSTAGDVGVDEDEGDAGAGPSMSNMQAAHHAPSQRRARTAYDVRSSRRDMTSSKNSSPYMGDYETRRYSPSSASSSRQRSNDGTDDFASWSKHSSDSNYSNIKMQSRAVGWTRRERLPSAQSSRGLEPRSAPDEIESTMISSPRPGANRIRAASGPGSPPTSSPRGGNAVNGAPSLAERKRRLASASGNASLVEASLLPPRQLPRSPEQLSANAVESAVFGSAQRRDRRGDTVRNGSYTQFTAPQPPPPPPPPPIQAPTEDLGSTDQDVSADSLSAAKLSLRERIFGARRQAVPSPPRTTDRPPQRSEAEDQSFDSSGIRASRSDPRFLDASSVTPSASDKTMQYRSPRGHNGDEGARNLPRATPERSRLDVATRNIRSRSAERLTHGSSARGDGEGSTDREQYGTPEVLDRDHYDIEAASRDSASSLDWQREDDAQDTSEGPQMWQETAGNMSTSSSGMDNERYSVAPSPDDARAHSNGASSASGANGRPVPVPRTTSLRNMRHSKRDKGTAPAGSTATSSNGMDSPMRSHTAMSSYVESNSSMNGSIASEARLTTPPLSLRAISETRSSWRESTADAEGVEGSTTLAGKRTTFGEGSRSQSITPEQLDALQAQITRAASSSASGSQHSQPQSAGVRTSIASSEATQSKTSTTDSWQKIEHVTPTPQLTVAREPIRPRKSPLRIHTPRNSESFNPREVIERQTSGSKEQAGRQPKIADAVDAQSHGSQVQPATEPSLKRDASLGPSAAASSRPSSSNAFESSDTLATAQPLASAEETQDALLDPQDAYRSTADVQHTPKTLARRAMTLRRITPPALVLPFTRKDKISTSSLTPLEGPSELQEAGSVDEPAGLTTDDGPRKSSVSKVFKFKKDREEREASKSSLGSRSKREAASSRPSIRRIYDDHTTVDADGDGGSTGTRSAIDSPMIESALASPGHGLLSLPQTPVEDLPPHAKRLVRRCNALSELVETEASYASDLNVVRDVYLAHAKERLGSPVASLLQPTKANGNLSVVSLPQPKGPNAAGASTTSLGSKTASRSMQSVPHKDGLLAHTSSSLTGFSNRSSVYTTSSQTSGSDLSGAWPPTSASMPATPPIVQQAQASSSHPKLAALSRPASLLRTPSQTRVGTVAKPRISVSTSAGSGLSDRASRDAPLSTADVRIIFAHLEEAAALADTMAQALRSALGSLSTNGLQAATQKQSSVMTSDDRLGLAFRAFIPQVQAVFTAYCSRHESSMQRLQEVIAHSPNAAKFLQECTPEARRRTTAWDLGSLLIKPVQRVLKYPLLLREIVNATDPAHPDYANLVASFEEMSRVADQINQVKRRRDLADSLIYERTGKEVNGQRLGSASKAKKKASSKSLFSTGTEGTLLMEDPGDEAIEDFTALLQSFNLLQQRTIAFGRRCRSWSIALFNTYQSEITLVSRMQQIYALQAPEISANGQVEPRSDRTPASGEEKVLLGYIALLKLVIDRSWRAMDAEIARSILPMTQKIEEMFDAPRLVIAKRAERQADYNRYRQIMAVEGGHSKTPDRKIVENANGFIALQGQLLDEIPQFMQAIQALLDVGVQALARLQAAHMDEVRTLLLTYWSKEGEHGEEVDLLGADRSGMGPRLREMHLVRKFWEAQHNTLEQMQTLRIGQQHFDEVLAGGGEVFHTPLSERIANFDATNTALSPYVGADESRGSSSTNLASSRYDNSNASSSSVLPGPGLRRPSGGVAGLMRSISGSFVKEPSPRSEAPPPLPPQATSKVKKHAADVSIADTTADSFQSAVSDVPPSLPSLMFKEEDRGGFFIQNRPISFLDSREQASAKTPLASPLQEVVYQQMGAYANGAASTKRPGHAKTRSQVIRDFYVAVAQQDSPHESVIKAQPSPRMTSAQLSHDIDADGNAGMRRNGLGKDDARRATGMASALSSETLPPPPAEKEMQKHLEWPYVRFVRGDTFKVISCDATSKLGTVLLFGRIDRTGELGWADETAFAVAA